MSDVRPVRGGAGVGQRPFTRIGQKTVTAIIVMANPFSGTKCPCAKEKTDV